MRTLNLLIVLLVSATVVYSQKYKIKEFAPARGHYKALQSFDARPKSAGEEIDKQKFPYNETSAEKRLSLKPYYLENVRLDEFKVPDPPANSSEQTRAEINYLLSLQQQRTTLDVESSLYMAGVFYSNRIQPEDSLYSYYRRNLFHIGRSIGSWFNPENLPLTAELMANVWRDASYFIWSLKYKYLRIRPYVIDADLKNLEDANWAAYPSGHAANSYVNAYIYQELAPEFADMFIKDAYDMAHSREILGVHYPSDSEASRIFAYQLVNKLFENKKFLKDFEQVKKEWATKGKETFAKPALNILNKASSCENKPTSVCAKTCQ